MNLVFYKIMADRIIWIKKIDIITVCRKSGIKTAFGIKMLFKLFNK